MKAQIGWLRGVPAIQIYLEDNDIVVISHGSSVGLRNDSEGFESFKSIEVDDELGWSADSALNAPHPSDNDWDCVAQSRQLVEELPCR